MPWRLHASPRIPLPGGCVKSYGQNRRHFDRREKSPAATPSPGSLGDLAYAQLRVSLRSMRFLTSFEMTGTSFEMTGTPFEMTANLPRSFRTSSPERGMGSASGAEAPEAVGRFFPFGGEPEGAFSILYISSRSVSRAFGSSARRRGVRSRCRIAPCLLPAGGLGGRLFSRCRPSRSRPPRG